jgi:hypothetical protein
MSGLALSSGTRRPLVLATALFVAVAWFAVVSPAANAAKKPCWERVVDDWVDNGTFDGAYPPACLQAALKHVPEDIRAYSDFEERLKQARQEAFRARVLQGRTGSDSDPAPGTRPQIKQAEPDVKPAESDGPIPQVLRKGTNDASSIPLPLIILAVLALVLMSAGAAGFAHRTLRARKLRP